MAGTGDHNSDGRSDILNRKDVSDMFWEYQLNGTKISGGSAVTSAPTDWGAVG